MLFIFGIATLAQGLRLEPVSEAPPATVSLGVGVKDPILVTVTDRRAGTDRSTGALGCSSCR
jgi:hypothetical protein